MLFKTKYDSINLEASKLQKTASNKNMKNKYKTDGDWVIAVIVLVLIAVGGLWHANKVDKVVANCVPNHELRICE